MRRAAAFVLSSALVVSPAARGAAEDAVPQAKAYYDAGAKAYAAGSYGAAVQAFTEAYRLAQRPTVLFSLAQAERRKYTADRDARALRDAIAHYRAYIEAVPQGGRRADAVEAIAELEAIAARLDRSSAAAEPQRAPPRTRLMVFTQVEAAVVTLDGVPHAELPLIEEVKPGKHEVRVAAPGYVDERREVIAVEGTLIPLDVTLRARPSYLSLSTTPGARVALDGMPLGEAPLPRVEVPAGSHLVTVTKTGHSPYVAPVVVARGEAASLRVALEQTKQRQLAYVLIGASAATAVASGVLGLGALRQEDIARKTEDDIKHKNITPAELEVHNRALSSRNELRGAALGTAGAAFVVALTAAGLYLFDDPAPSAREGARGVSGAPGVSFAIGPEGAGAEVSVRF